MSGFVLWFTGLSGAGKSTIAKRVEQALHAAGRHTYSLDGDNLRMAFAATLASRQRTASKTSGVRARWFG